MEKHVTRKLWNESMSILLCSVFSWCSFCAETDAPSRFRFPRGAARVTPAGWAAMKYCRPVSPGLGWKFGRPRIISSTVSPGHVYFYRWCRSFWIHRKFWTPYCMGYQKLLPPLCGWGCFSRVLLLAVLFYCCYWFYSFCPLINWRYKNDNRNNILCLICSCNFVFIFNIVLCNIVFVKLLQIILW